MGQLGIFSNSVLGTGFGHTQFVYDPDDGPEFDGNELEIEVQSGANWSVEPVDAYSHTQAQPGIVLDLPDPDATWALLLKVRDYFATQDIAYTLGVFGATEGQNSNSYVATLAHIVGLSGMISESTFLGSGITSLPGFARNVLFDRIDGVESPVAPLALTLTGTASGDHIAAGNGADSLDGADGDDRLFGFGAGDMLFGGAGRDRLRGGAGDDLLDGGLDRDRVHGDRGRDTLTGDAQADRLFGGAGRDVLIGGQGGDRLKGGAAADTFLFGGEKGRDTILDFEDNRDIISFAGSGLTADDVTVTGDIDALISGAGFSITVIGMSAADVLNDITF